MEEGLCTDRDGGDFTVKGVFVLREVKENRSVGKERL